jgi:Ni/Co efflux regulator RcnB
LKLILAVTTMAALVVPTAASASVVKADLKGGPAYLIKIDDDDDDGGRGKHRRKKHHDHGGDYRDDRRAYREGYRDGRRQARWDGSYHPGQVYGHRRFGRGEYLPREYRGYVVNNYHDFGYPPPPRGCRYVQVGQDTYLTQIATGLILNAFLGGRY